MDEESQSQLGTGAHSPAHTLGERLKRVYRVVILLLLLASRVVLRAAARFIAACGVCRVATARLTSVYSQACTIYARVRAWMEPALDRVRPIAISLYGIVRPVVGALLHLMGRLLRIVWDRASRWLARRPAVIRLRARIAPLLERYGLRRRQTQLAAGLILVAMLTTTVLIPLIPLVDAVNDYSDMRTLSQDGIQHLGAAQALLATLAGGAASNSNGEPGQTLTSLLQILAPQIDSAGSAGPTSQPLYTYVIQRQAGTAYPMTVVVRPSPRMAAAGLSEQRFSVTVDQTTTLRYSAPPPSVSAPVAPTGSTIPTATRTPEDSRHASLTPTATPPPTPLPTPPTSPTSGTPPARDARAPLDARAAIAEVGIELRAAQASFARLRARVDGPNWLLALASALPGTRVSATAVHALADAGYAIASLGVALVDIAGRALPSAGQAGATGNTSGNAAPAAPPLTAHDLTTLERTLALLAQSLDTLQGQLAPANLGGLPLSPAQRAELAQALALLPQIRAAVRQAQALFPALGWMLGAGHPRRLLVQTLDRAELRPSGGFTGDYGVLTLDNGRVSPFGLDNINDIEYGYKSNGWIYGKRPPNEYAWWPFANWGLRDANLSADFPTTARMAIQLFKNEGQGDVDGVIQFTPTLVAHVLRVTGPIVVPDYGETITADNLEERIHYYQQDPAGIAKQQQLNPTDHTHSLRKRFTQLVTQLLQEKLKQLPLERFAPLALQVLDDWRAKDLQIYLADRDAESRLLQLHLAGAVETPAAAGADSVLFVQANVSAAKSTPYVDVTQTDVVTLDDQGGATHRVTITLLNDPRGPIYGYPTYRDYVRFYVPATARVTSGSGFDSETPLCYMPPPAPASPAAPAPNRGPGATGTPSAQAPAATPSATPPPAPIPTPVRPAQYASLPTCSANPYPAAERTCPAAAYEPGGQAYTVLSWGNGTVPVLDTVGPPTGITRDLPGMVMRGGYVIVPLSCAARVTLGWYVPNIARMPG